MRLAAIETDVHDFTTLLQGARQEITDAVNGQVQQGQQIVATAQQQVPVEARPLVPALIGAALGWWAYGKIGAGAGAVLLYMMYNKKE